MIKQFFNRSCRPPAKKQNSWRRHLQPQSFLLYVQYSTLAAALLSHTHNITFYLSLLCRHDMHICTLSYISAVGGRHQSVGLVSNRLLIFRVHNKAIHAHISTYVVRDILVTNFQNIETLHRHSSPFWMAHFFFFFLGIMRRKAYISS